MNRAELTALYLDEVKRRGATASELSQVLTKSKAEGFHSLYGGRYLSRPVFLGYEETQQLYTDVSNVRRALVSLPDRLYGGDVAAFARAIGMAEVQVSAIVRSRGITVTSQSRADMYSDETGFKVLEFNMGSALGGIDHCDIAEAMLEHPVLADFVEAHELEHVDLMREQVYNMFVESGFEPGSNKVLVTTDWPSSFKTLEPYMRHFQVRLREMGVDAHICHIGQLEVRDGGVWLGDTKVDIIQRLFMIEDLLEYPDAPALMDPILDAAARGEVKIFTPMDAEMYASKGALAMLSDEKNRSLLDPDELASVDRILPWTRMVRPGPVTLEDGSEVDLLDYVLANQDDLALKPTSLHGGKGVLLGWPEETTPEAWEEQVRAAMDGPYVIQRRIRPVPELFPTDDADPAPFILSWGVFTVANGFGGIFTRGSSVESHNELLQVASGAAVGCGMHVRPETAV